MKKINLTISNDVDKKFKFIQKNNNITTQDETFDRIINAIDENIVLNEK